MKIVCVNMLFVNILKGEYGIYFIGYVSIFSIIYKMLENMFIGDFVGNIDCLLDFSILIIGILFFVFLYDLFVKFGE